MSRPRHSSTSSDFDFFNQSGNYQYQQTLPESPLIFPQDVTQDMTFDFSTSPIYPTSTAHVSHHGNLSMSAPTTDPLFRSETCWTQDNSQLIVPNSYFSDTFDNDTTVSPIDIPQASSHSRSLMPTQEGSAAQDIFFMQSLNVPVSNDSSLDSSLEPFPNFSNSPAVGYFHPSSWGSEITTPYMYRTESQFSNDSLRSYEADPQPPSWQEDINEYLEFDTEPFVLTGLTSSPINVTKINNSAGIKKRTRRVFSASEREKTAFIRKIGACKSCKLRKLRCDDGIPCQRCIKQYGSDLALNPCRGDDLNTIVRFILQDNNFPREDWRRFLKQSPCQIGTDRYKINLDLGFGTPFPCNVNLINLLPNPTAEYPFLHKHEEYVWPPAPGETWHQSRHDFVFPAKIADESGMEKGLDRYLSVLVDDRESFAHFPAWRSDLNVLRDIYWMHLSLPKGNQKSPLEKALKLLILVHCGADVRIVDDENSMRVARHYMRGFNGYRVTACFIRAQLGPVFRSLARKLMKEILTELEILSPCEDIKKYPLMVATFSTLFMVMESLQFHNARIPFHDDAPAIPYKEGQVRDLEEIDGANVLLRFYKGTKCHAVLGTIAKDSSMPASCTSLENDPTGFLNALATTVAQATPYLNALVAKKQAPIKDLSCFFDRLLAKMYLLDSEITSPTS